MASTIDVKIYTTLHSRIEEEVQFLKSNDFDVNNNNDDRNNDLLMKYNKLMRFYNEIDMLRSHTFENESFSSLDQKLHSTSRDIKNLILDIEIQIENYYNKLVRQKKLEEQEEINKLNKKENLQDIEKINKLDQHQDYQTEESIESLKSRLLSTRNNQLDQIQSVEVQNNYHESIQQELMDSLPSMVSSLKEQALQFQEMIKQDAVILKEASQNFENSHGKFNNVNTLLSKYHKEGRLGFWFYVRIISMVLVAFLFILIIIRLIPARH